MDTDTARKLFAGMNAAFGLLFLLAPRLALRLYGLDPDADRRAGLALRYFGGRALLIAVLLMNEDSADAVLAQLPMVVACDAIACGAAAATGEVPLKTALLGAASTAGTAVIGFQARA